MATAVPLAIDSTPLGRIVRAIFTLGVIQAAVVVVESVNTHVFDGTIEHALSGVIVFVGAMITIFYPSTVTQPRTIEGISAGAGIGLGATWVFLLFDAFLLQTFHAYTNRWHEIGGGSIWWYLPVWWMVGTYASWMGTWIIANQTNKSGHGSIPMAIVLVAVVAAVLGAIAAAVHFPHAGWNVPTFAVALIPGLAIANLISALGVRRA